MASDRMEPATEDLADPWFNRPLNTSFGGPAYAGFLESFRDLLDTVAAANPPEEIWERARQVCRDLTEELEPWWAPERNQPSGSRIDLPGRGDPFLLPFVPLESTDTFVRGKVVFRRLHLGGGGAAHGGTLPLLFDEVLGRLSNSGDRPTARTAYLKVNYRHITPLNTELDVEARLEREDGRKRWIRGRLALGDTLLADAEGLFIQLRPGQP
jgi:hypothetical protein